MTEPLFPGYPDPLPDEPLPPAEERHARRRAGVERRRARVEQAMAAGLHPLTLASDTPRGLPLLNGDGGGHTCGDCLHKERHQMGGSWLKCALGPQSRGPATDLLARWPACQRWEESP